MREQKIKNYLKTIFIMQEEGEVRGVYLARELEVSKATVSITLRDLEAGGYISIQPDHTVRLSPEGLKLAKEAMHETVYQGRRYHSVLQKIGADVSDFEDDGADLVNWLRREDLSVLLEAVFILSRHYYRVRSTDLRDCLELPNSTITRGLARLEQKGLISAGERNTLSLTESGRHYASVFYNEKEQQREKLIRQGLPKEEAELQVLKQEKERK